jgi:hypothetical protein
MNQRALEAGARALCVEQFGNEVIHGDARCCQLGGTDGCCVESLMDQAAAVITAYESHLAAEGFVVVPAIPTQAMMRAAQSTNNNHTPDKWAAMLSAATTGENDALPDGERP